MEADGHDLDHPLWSAKVLLESPDAARAVHRRFLEAGADCIVTATYQASFPGLEAEGLTGEQARAVFGRAVRLATEARDAFRRGAGRAREPDARRRPLVAGGVGPYGAFLADGSEYRGDYRLSDREFREFHEPRLRTLSTSPGLDLLAVETIPSADEAIALAGLLTDAPEPRPPAWISLCCRDGVRVADGTPLFDLARELDRFPGVTALGVNCTPAEHVTSLLGELRRGAGGPFVVYPNAGGAWDADRKRWDDPPEEPDWGERTREWTAAGAFGVGGCCRVGPRAIRAIRAALNREDRPEGRDRRSSPAAAS